VPGPQSGLPPTCLRRAGYAGRAFTVSADVAAISQHFLAEVDKLAPLLLQYGVFLIMVAIAVEGFGIPAPGQTLLIAGAVLAARGSFNIQVLLLGAWLAAVVGAAIGYAAGRLGGSKLLLHLPVNAARLDRLQRLCRDYGGLFVVLARFFDGLRQLGNILVGTLNMPTVEFMLMNALGSAAWVAVWGLGPYYLHAHFHAIALRFRELSPYTWLAAGLLLVVILAYVVRRGRSSGQQPD
jgi:membrane protein DedA with SNARE-associated domain